VLFFRLCGGIAASSAKHFGPIAASNTLSSICLSLLKAPCLLIADSTNDTTGFFNFQEIRSSAISFFIRHSGISEIQCKLNKLNTTKENKKAAVQ